MSGQASSGSPPGILEGIREVTLPVMTAKVDGPLPEPDAPRYPAGPHGEGSLVCSVPWPALVVSLLVISGPVAAQQRPSGRVSQRRTLTLSVGAEGTGPELHVAGGTATVVSVDVPLGPEGPSLEEEHGQVRLVPLEGASFIVLPAADVAGGEHPWLTVPLQSGASLRLALRTLEGEVDTEVKLVALQTPAAPEDGVGQVARMLNASSGPVALCLPEKRFLVGGGVRIRLKSVLRLDQHLFVTLAAWSRPLSPQEWAQVRFHVVLADGEVVLLPVLRVSALSSSSFAQQKTLVVALPDGAARLLLNMKNSPEVALTVSLDRMEPTP